MVVVVTNAQRESPVNVTRMARLARDTIKQLRIHTPGKLAITFIASRRMRALNKRFLRHDRMTDVLSFRYDNARGSGLGARGNYPQPPRPADYESRGGPAHSPQPIVGEILIAPAMARIYAREHGVSYTEELARYVVHGLLHWLGHEDRTPAEQKRMRAREDRVLAQCATKSPMTKSQSPNNHQ